MDIAAIYMRLSREDSDKNGDESESIQNQRLILDRYADEHNWRIYDYYIDEDWSGSDRSRPEFHRLIDDAGKGKFNIVLVKTQSRFARDSKFIEDYIHELFRDNGIRFVSVVDNIDTAMQGAKLSSRFHAIFDEEMLDLLSSNIKRSFTEKARQGQFFGSLPPYGYKKDINNKNHLVIDDEAAKVVRWIFEMTAQGKTYLEIAKLLNNYGCPTPAQYKAKKGYNVKNMYNSSYNQIWTRDTVRTILNNEVYRGTIINHKSTVVNFRTKRKCTIPKSQQIKVYDMHEPIIKQELWKQIERIKHARQRAGNGASGKKHFLSGIIYCGKCGAKMYRCKSGDIEYFRCSRAVNSDTCNNKKRVRIDEIKKILINVINSLIAEYVDFNIIKKYIVTEKNTEHYLNHCTDKIAELNSELKRNILSLKELLNQYIEGIVDKSVYEEMQHDYLSKKSQIKKQISTLDNQMTVLKNSEYKNYYDYICKYKNINELNFLIINTFIQSITIGEVSNNNHRNISITLTI